VDDVPHRQVPVGEQLSEPTRLQTLHAAPPMPHFGNDGTVHVIVEQHPVGQEVGLQTHEPALHS